MIPLLSVLLLAISVNSLFFLISLAKAFIIIIIIILLSSEVHVQNVQVCYIGIHVPWWFAASIAPSSTLPISPNAIPPLSSHPLLSLP